MSQDALRQMMAKMKADKGDGGRADAKRKYKLGAKEVALLEQEKRRKTEERIQEKKDASKKAGVPENFFDSAKTKAFLNLNKAPQKSILKNSSKPAAKKVEPSMAANSKATGKEWTSKAPELVIQPEPRTKETEVPKDFFDKKEADAEEKGKEEEEEEEAGLPAGFFDDQEKDAKARGVEYKVRGGQVDRRSGGLVALWSGGQVVRWPGGQVVRWSGGQVAWWPGGEVR